MHKPETCPKCATDLSDDAPEGLCPACLFQQALEDSDFENGAMGQSNSPAPTFVPPAPADLARYFPQLEILEHLGKEAWGRYKARQSKLDRLIAVKVLPPEVAPRPGAFAERFMRGRVRWLASIIRTLSRFTISAKPAPLLLQHGVCRRQQCSPAHACGQALAAQTVPIVSQVCDALRCAHDEGSFIATSSRRISCSTKRVA